MRGRSSDDLVIGTHLGLGTEFHHLHHNLSAALVTPILSCTSLIIVIFSNHMIVIVIIREILRFYCV